MGISLGTTSLYVMKRVNILSFLIAISLLFIVGCSKDNPIDAGTSAPIFNYISPNWISQYNKMDMHNIWLIDGIDREGYNYYFLPKAVSPNTCSERFNPNSNYFQSWFGMYTLSDNSKGTYAIQNTELNTMDIIKLGISDQKAWLNSFAGLDTPTVYLDTTEKISVEKIVIDNTNGWKISGRIISNADVGENNAQNLQDIINVNKSLWEDIIDSYQQIGLDIYIYVWYSSENKELNVAYYNGVDFIDKNLIKHKTIDSIATELQKMVNNITVQE